MSVINSVLDDLVIFTLRRLLSVDDALRWSGDLRYLLEQRALEKFELQLTPPTGDRLGLRYTATYGQRSQGDDSGGLNLYTLPDQTRFTILVGYPSGLPNLEQVREEMRHRGWTSTGTFLEGHAQHTRTYSDPFLSLRRALIVGEP